MSEKLKNVPEGLGEFWNNLSYQMRGRIKAFGLPPSPSRRLGLNQEQWNNLSYQMRGRIMSKRSMEETRETGKIIT